MCVANMNSRYIRPGAHTTIWRRNKRIAAIANYAKTIFQPQQQRQQQQQQTANKLQLHVATTTPASATTTNTTAKPRQELRAASPNPNPKPSANVHSAVPGRRFVFSGFCVKVFETFVPPTTMANIFGFETI